MKHPTVIHTRTRGSRECSLTHTKTARNVYIVARCWVIAHDAMTSGQYVYGLKLAEKSDEVHARRMCV